MNIWVWKAGKEKETVSEFFNKAIKKGLNEDGTDATFLIKDLKINSVESHDRNTVTIKYDKDDIEIDLTGTDKDWIDLFKKVFGFMGKE